MMRRPTTPVRPGRLLEPRILVCIPTYDERDNHRQHVICEQRFKFSGSAIVEWNRIGGCRSLREPVLDTQFSSCCRVQRLPGRGIDRTVFEN